MKNALMWMSQISTALIYSEKNVGSERNMHIAQQGLATGEFNCARTPLGRSQLDEWSFRAGLLATDIRR